MDSYVYRPKRFFALAILITWAFWFAVIVFFKDNEALSTLGMLLGLLAPAVTAIVTVLTSKNSALKKDFGKKFIGISRLNVWTLILAILMYFAVVGISILVSVKFGQSLDQFRFTDDFTFSGPGVSSALFTILLASAIEEVGWRGYGVDSIAQYKTWFATSLFFGIAWALWHLPLFWIPGTYQFGLREMGALHMANFFVCCLPMGFLTSWVYVKNNRSILAGIFYHLFLNFLQEKIAMTPITKCIETGVLIIFAIIVVLANRSLFFDKEHIGNLPNC